MITEKKLYQSLKNMVEWTKQVQLCRKEDVEFMGYKAWANESCTIAFRLPRQSGHTEFAKRLYREQIFKNPIYIVPHKQRFKPDIADCFGYRATTISELENNPRFRGESFDGVIVDCSFALSNSRMERIYNYFKFRYKDYPTFCFLFLE